jgi:hypothetical protein
MLLHSGAGCFFTVNYVNVKVQFVISVVVFSVRFSLLPYVPPPFFSVLFISVFAHGA